MCMYIRVLMYCTALSQVAKGLASDLHLKTTGGGNAGDMDEID